jgi:hypothetical protein
VGPNHLAIPANLQAKYQNPWQWFPEQWTLDRGPWLVPKNYISTKTLTDGLLNVQALKVSFSMAVVKLKSPGDVKLLCAPRIAIKQKPLKSTKIPFEASK